MRLTALSLQHYGNFRMESLRFDTRPGVLNLIVAPNGAGKSVLRSAFCDLLFGIGGQTPMGFRYGYSGMRIGVETLDSHGNRFAFGRRKGHGNTLVDEDGAQLDPSRIATVLGRTDRTQLERLFALDTERLRQGEAELLSSNGALADALEAGAGGVRHARRLRQAMEAQRDALAPSRKSAQRPFYLAVDRYTDARRRISASLLKPDQWEKLQQELETARTQQGAQNRLADETSREIARLERVRRVSPFLAARDTAAAWLDAHPDAPVLDPALKQSLDDIRAAILVREERVRSGVRRRDELAQQVQAIAIDTALLAEGDAIDALTDPAGAARKAMTDLPSRSADLAAREATIRALLRELGSGLPPERAAEAIPSRAVTGRARRLLRDYAARTEAVRDTPSRIVTLETTLADLDRRIAALPAVDDHATLSDLLKEIGGDGDPIRRRRDAAAAEEQAVADLEADLARVPGWTGDAEALARLAPLPPESYADRSADLDAARNEAAARLTQVAEARQAQDGAQRRLEALTGAGRLPEEADLAAARARRDVGWQLIYRRAFTPDPPSAADMEGFAGPLPLPLAYERAVAVSDQIADRRAAEAASIEQVAVARQQVQDAAERVREAEERHRLAAESVAALERVWSQLCAILPLGPSPTLRAVHAFLAARDRVVDTMRKLRTACQARESQRQLHASWSTQLTAALGLPEDPGLDVPRAEAGRRVDAARKAEADRAALLAQRDAAEKALAEARTRLSTAEQDLAAWLSDWEKAAADLGRPAGEDPRVSEDLLQVIADLDQAQKDAAALRERVSGMTADNERFRAMVAALAATLAPELAAMDPFTAVQEFRRRLQEVREQAKQLHLLHEQHVAASSEADAAERQLGDQRAVLAGVLLRIGAGTVEDADRRLALAAERARYAAHLAEAEAHLPAAGDGLPIEQLRADIASVPADDMAARLEHAAVVRRQAQEHAQLEAARVSTLTQEIARVETDSGAREAASDQQAAVATIGRVLDDALVLHVAAELLRVSLAAVEQSADSSALRRIGALFAALTDGAYTRVLAESEDESGPRLILVQRDFPEERQAVRDLSEGTRDQLYLALRLAAIEAHAQGSPVLPFIGDDILQTFDDDRALATMRVLCELSATTQVILLTHHRHLVELASRLPSGAVHLVRLGEMVPA